MIRLFIWTDNWQPDLAFNAYVTPVSCVYDICCGCCLTCYGASTCDEACGEAEIDMSPSEPGEVEPYVMPLFKWMAQQ